MTCRNCEDNRWVCEAHPSVNWDGGDGCCGGAGMPCPACNACGPNEWPADEPGTVALAWLCGTPPGTGTVQ